MFNYLREFIRILEPEGILMFQLPYKATIKKQIKNFLKRNIPESILNLYRKWTTNTTAHMNMYYYQPKKIETLLIKSGAILLKIIPCEIYKNTGYSSYFYIFKKA